MIYIIGGRGRLGRALVEEYRDCRVIIPERREYEDWAKPNNKERVKKFFSDNIDKGDVIFIASGLLDSINPDSDLLNVNYHLPKNIIEGTTDFGVKVITFGTVLETLPQVKNTYVKSKVLLGDYITNISSLNTNAIHIRLHTLYGMGRPSPFMFLGQIYDSIRCDSEFKMTSGEQLREYHHVEDECRAIRYIENKLQQGIYTLSHSRPVKLRQIAEAAFSAFNKSNLLKVGALNDPVIDNYDLVYDKLNLGRDLNFRSTIPSVVEYMKSVLKA